MIRVDENYLKLVLTGCRLTDGYAVDRTIAQGSLSVAHSGCAPRGKTGIKIRDKLVGKIATEICGHT